MSRLTTGQLRDLLSKTSPAPWRYDAQDGRKNQRIVMFEEIVPEYSPDRPLATVSATAWRPERHRNAKFNAALIAMAPDLAAEVLQQREIVEAATDLVALWKALKVSGLPRADRNAAIESARERLIAASASLTPARHGE